MSTLGERFREIRKVRGLNQKEFAGELGVSQNHISSIENDKEKPSAALQKLVCYKFSIDEEWLREGKGGCLSEYNIPIIDGTVDEDALYSAKYGELRVIMDSMLKERSGNELKYTVMALNYLVGLLSCYKLKQENQEEYLCAVYNVLDKMELLEHRSSSILSYGKKQYKHFLEYKNMIEATLSYIDQQLRAMNNIYLKQYELDKDIRL